MLQWAFIAYPSLLFLAKVRFIFLKQLSTFLFLYVYSSVKYSIHKIFGQKYVLD